MACSRIPSEASSTNEERRNGGSGGYRESGGESILWWLLGYGVKGGRKVPVAEQTEMAFNRFAPREEMSVVTAVTRLRILGHLTLGNLGDLVAQQEKKMRRSTCKSREERLQCQE